MSNLVDAAIARLQGLFIEPSAPPVRSAISERPALAPTRHEGPVREVEVVVVGLSRACGSSTISAGLALALAAHGRPANLITLGDSGGDGEQARLGPVRVWQLPSALFDPAEVSQYGGVVARIAGGRGMGGGSTATVWDVPARVAERAAGVLGDVDVVVAVARGDSDPALADLASSLIAERCARVLLAANRTALDGDWRGRACVCAPDSRVSSRLVRRGRLPGGAFGGALRELATLVEGE